MMSRGDNIKGWAIKNQDFIDVQDFITSRKREQPWLYVGVMLKCFKNIRVAIYSLEIAIFYSIYGLVHDPVKVLIQNVPYGILSVFVNEINQLLKNCINSL
jgi:hypothetical protein